MHLVCLGIMKKLLVTWTKGRKSNKLSVKQRDIISKRMRFYRKFVPKNFARKPRGLEDLSYWKAREYRSFLLYWGPVCLRGVLPEEKYEHFLKFHTAIYILISPSANYTTWVDYADTLIRDFVSMVPRLYGKEFLVYNMHSLMHLCQDVKLHGQLDNFSAFDFESYMQNLKRMLRSKSNHISQVINRVKEYETLENCRLMLSKTNDSDCKVGECWIHDSGTVGLIFKYSGEMVFRKFDSFLNVKSYPLKSEKLFIGFVSNLGPSIHFSRTDLVKKCLLLSYKDKQLCIPMCNS